MKFYVPTYPRVGSTWVCETLLGLMEVEKRYEFVAAPEHVKGRPVNEKLEEELLAFEGPCVVKAHDFAPMDMLGVLRKEEDSYIVLVKRNFLDTLTSQVYYERDVKPQLKQSRDPQFRMFDEWPDMPIEAALNLLVECHKKWVSKNIQSWLYSTHVIVNRKLLVVNYDKLANEGDELALKLNKVVETPKSVVEDVAERTSFHAMKKRHLKGFVRCGQPGSSHRYFDPRSVEWISKEIGRLTQEQMRIQ